MNRFMLGVAASLIAVGAAKAEDVTLQLWTWYPAEAVVTKIIDGFEAANPGVQINLNLMESTAYQDKMPLALSSGDPMDVVAVQTSTMVNLVKDGLEPLPALFEANGSAPIDTLLSASALTQARSLASDGELYIAPMGVLGSVAMYYNADLMAELGLELPRTRADLAAFVATVREKRPDLEPISFTGANWFLDEITLTIAEQASPGFFNSVRYNTGGKWDSPEYTKAYDAIVGLYKDEIFSRQTLDLDYGRAAELFQQGKAVAYMQGTWETGYLSAPFRAANKITLTNVVASGLPVLFEGAAPSIRSFIEVAWAVPKQSAHKDLATKFIEYVTAGAGVDAWSDTLFVVPAKMGATIPEGVFSSDAAKASYDELSALLLAPGSDRNNVSDFSAAAGDAIIASINSGTATADQVKYLQAEWDSGRYSNAN